ncbi:MAG: hypothetical protein KDA79_21260, partial [Planctomycetaceae bacterium]|nr:hypothetical protein [Planctomycetaceae bacterium]
MFSAQPSGMYPFADRSAPDQDPAAAPVPAAPGVKESAQTPEQSPQAERIPTADSDRPETIS